MTTQSFHKRSSENVFRLASEVGRLITNQKTFFRSLQISQRKKMLIHLLRRSHSVKLHITCQNWNHQQYIWCWCRVIGGATRNGYWDLSLTPYIHVTVPLYTFPICTYIFTCPCTCPLSSNRLWAPCRTSESLSLSESICVYLHLSVVSTGTILCFICACP